MALSDVFKSLKTNYNSRLDDIIGDLYKPCFKNSSTYYRGSAYFRTSVVELYRNEVLDFCRNNDSKIAILTSTDVVLDDVKAIRDGYLQRGFENNLDQLFDEAELVDSAKFVATLIAMNKLDIYIVNGSLYHDKVGFFEDSESNIVAFTGSGNETKPGLGIDGNYERYVVSWNSSPCFDSYGMYWSNELRNAIDKLEYAGAEIVRFDQFTGEFLHKHDIKKSLEEFDELNLIEYDVNYFNYDILSPNGPQKHQLRAYQGWIDNNYRGLFEHATGTYKTATGLLCADHYLGENKNVVISAPLQIIAQNWYDLIDKCFDSQISVIRCWGENLNWKSELADVVDRGKKVILIFVTNSLWKEEGMDALRILRNKYLLIADEAHNWDRPDARSFLEKNEPLARIALTAKLSEPGEEEKTAHVLEYFAFGHRLFIDSLSLETAISMGFLRKYHYKLKPIDVDFTFTGNLSDDARNIWNDFQKQKRIASPEIAVSSLSTKKRVLTYTGPHIVQLQPVLENMQRLWNLNENRPVLFKRMTGKELPPEREIIIQEFNTGITRGLVAIRVLDEGVDLPVSDAAVMAKSKASYRQWTQRRGRILRKKLNSDKSTAIIYDFILNLSKCESELAEKICDNHRDEIDRIIEFSRCSINGPTEAISLLEQCGW
ncbi:DEAD/DEAH box helicase family protein [Euryarchaeota archaeon]|nr:DEAD/DEAH box helicase family protein [Euryarchaeota archaeon]